MAIAQGICTSFKQELLTATHDLTSDVLKIALFSPSANLGLTTQTYSTTNEVVGTGYTAGGVTVTNVVISVSGTSAVITFDDASWSNLTTTARGALLYNSSKGNKAIAVFAFGENKTVSNGNFVLTSSADLLRIS